MSSDDWDSIMGDDGQHRWVYNNPANGSQRVGPTLHKSRGAAIAAGKKWLKDKQ